MKIFVGLWRFFIFSNLLIAFAAASQSLLTYYVLQIPINWGIVFLEWSATLLLYNFSMWLSMPRQLGNSPFRRTKWYFKNRPIFFSFSFFAILIGLLTLLQLHLYTFFFLCIIGVLCLGYATPIIKRDGQFLSLRAIAGLKVFLIAAVWALSVVGMPVLEYWSAGNALHWNSVLLWGLLEVLFILAITLPFDIRDIKQDKHYDLKTIPVLLGEKYAQVLCYGLIGLHAISLFLLSAIFGPVIWRLIAMDIVVILLFCTIVFKKKLNYERVYLLDLVLILQYLLVIYLCFLR